MRQGKKRMINNLREGVSKVITHEQLSPSVERKYVVADMITGYGVAEAVRNYYEFWNGNIVNKRVIIQGWGNVASAAAYYLAGFGAKIVGIIDRSGGLMNSNGLSFEEVRQLFLDKDGNKLVADKLMSFEEVNEKIWSMGAEIMVPAAASRLLTQEQLQQMIDNELEVISCGANVPFADEQIFMGPIATFADNNVSVIPDFIANCGMARVFAYLMSEEAQLDDTAIFKDTSNIIRKTLMRIQQFHPRKTGISAKALEMSLTTLLR
jgi:glutamate dehydrogenase/leucine dehydrogenase